MLKMFRFIVVLLMPALASCAAPAIDEHRPGRHEGLEIFVDGPRDLLSTFQLMRSDDEVWLKGPVRRPATEKKAPRTLYADDVDPSLSVIARAHQAGALPLASVNGLNDVYARAKAAHPPPDPYVNFVEIGKDVLRLEHGALVFNTTEGWVSRVPVRYSYGVAMAFNSVEKSIAFPYCEDYPKENSCSVSVFDIQEMVTEQLTQLTGNVDDMKFSCDGRTLYILVRQFSVKSGPIDSLFALAGHPNSDNYYRLVIFSMQDRSETTIEVMGTYHPGRGYLVEDCAERDR